MYSCVILTRHQIASWVMRRINNDSFGIGPHKMTEFIKVERPSVLFTRPPGTYITTRGAGNFRQRLVARRMDDDVVILFESSEHEEEDGFLRARMNQNLLCLNSFIKFTNLPAQ